MSDSEPDIEIGDTFSKNQLEEAFDTNFGYQIRGINLRVQNGQKYIILLSNEGEIYDDKVGRENSFRYIGEGLPEKGDQKKTPANKALMDAVNDPVPIYFFTSKDGIDKYEYQGLVDVEAYRYISDGERMVYEFEMEMLDIASWSKKMEIQKSIRKNHSEGPELTENQTHTTHQRRVRSSEFSKAIKEAYNNTCAICGKERYAPDGSPEVEAAHIYPKSEGGADDIRNGIALCKFHHWAFDSGWISLTDDLEIIVNDDPDTDTPDSIESLRGEELNKPEDTDKHPHELFIEARRDLYGLE